MGYNRRKSSNGIELGWIARLCVVGVFAAIIGISYVMIKHRLHDYGNMQLSLEKRLIELRDEDQALSAQIARWSSRAMLEQRLANGFIEMRPIEDERIVRLKITPVGGEDELRYVANELISE